MAEYVEPILSGEDFTSPVQDSREHWKKVYDALPPGHLSLGRALSNAYVTDPKMLSFVLARYKFVAKMLEGSRGKVLEIGCGDGFGSRLVEAVVQRLICTDVDTSGLLPQTNGCVWDFRVERWRAPVNAIYMIDVLEHIFPHECPVFFKNVMDSLVDDGVLIIGTPNATAQQYASENSRKGHVNLHSYDSLRTGMRHYFKNVFMFGMNDETLHCGFGPMCHYLFALCVGPKR